MTSYLRIIPIFVLMFAVAGCDSDSNEGDLGPNTYSATVTGSVNTTLSGSAVAAGGASGWGIVLSPGGVQTITIVAPGRSRPSAGTYPITVFGAIEGTGTQFIASVVAEAGVTSYQSTDGTLTLDSSTPTRVTGSFEFEAGRGTVANPQIVNVAGSFNAVNQDPTGGN